MREGYNKKTMSTHEKLIAWQLGDELDKKIQSLIRTLHRNEYKIIQQIDSASDSIGSNIVEGYYSGSTKEYRRFLRYSRRSCAEVQERVRRLNRKGMGDPKLREESITLCIRTGYILDRLILSINKKLE